MPSVALHTSPNALMLVDSHCHLTDSQFDEDRQETLRRAADSGVERVLSIASDLQDAESLLTLLEESRGWDGCPQIWGTAGVHPHEAEKAGAGDLDRIRGIARNNARIVAVGETGLDFFYDTSPRVVQESLFRDHMALAEELDLPIVVHSRNADALTAEILQAWAGQVRGVLHCYTGGPELLAAALGLGWMVSFTGMVTFKKYDGHELVRSVPRDRLMIETDAPYLAPVPFRGKRNEPGYVAKVAEGLAAIRGEDLTEVQGYTSSNATRFFRLVP